MLVRKTPQAAAATWQNITPPVGWTWDLPFNIQKLGSSYRVDPTFNLKTYAGITVTKTYWVKMASEGGSDGASGADEAHAFATIGFAISRADVDCVMIKAGTYTGYPSSQGWHGAGAVRSCQVIGYGGPVISAIDIVTSIITWSLVGNHYEGTYATSVGGIRDSSNLDVYGDEIPLALAADVASCDAAANSWWRNAGVLYVHTFDGRSPDANIKISIGTANGAMTAAITQYIEGISFHGGSGPAFNASLAGNGIKLYCKNCNFKNSSWWGTQDTFNITGGGGEVILQGCVSARGNGDAFKAQFSGAYVSNLAMIDCIGRYSGAVGNTNSNGYSRHGPGSTVAINTEFHHTYGPSMRDVNDGTLAWLLGCYAHDSLAAEGSNENFSCDNGTIIWLDGCRSVRAGNNDLVATAATGKIYYRNMTPANPTHAGGGTFAAY